jgi:hypothetical protein
MQFASLILTILLLPALSLAKSDVIKSKSKTKGDCNLNSSCGHPESSELNLNDSQTPIPGLTNLATGVKAAQSAPTSVVSSETWVSPTNMEPLTIAPTPPPYSSSEGSSGNQDNSSEKAR